MLNTSLTLHHPDAFSSFWLHVVPMWFTHGLRWRFFPLLLKYKYSGLLDTKRTIKDWGIIGVIWQGLKYFYLPWAFFNFCFLCVQPFCFLKDQETLFEWSLYGGIPDVRTDTFPERAKKVAIYSLLHMLLAIQGMVAASMSFKYQRVHFVWILAVVTQVITAAFGFYTQAATGDVGEGEGGASKAFTDGLWRCLYAWLFIVPTYCYCEWKGENETTSLVDARKRRK